jgi:anthranilate synthase component II
VKTLILDNYDSFTFNLFQAVSFLGGEPVVYKNDEILLEDIERGDFTHIVISPGPGTASKKEDFGVCGDVILKLGSKIPLLGVCLGHQGIVDQFGGKITHAPRIMHGKTSIIKIDTKCPIFKNLPEEIEVMRYHSLIGESLPDCLTKTAESLENKLIMAVQHKVHPIFGIQFHPESFKTPHGQKIISNFLSL